MKHTYKTICVMAVAVFLLAGCGNKSGHTAADTDSTVVATEAPAAADTVAAPEKGDSTEAAVSAPGGEDDLDIAMLPKTAERKDSYFQYAVYVNLDRPASGEGEMDAVYSVWLADERTGTVRKVCQTNPMAETQWERMKGENPDGVDVPLDQIASAERAWIAPGDVGKVIVEGCPDGRNYWTYIIDTVRRRALQLPATEGVQHLDWENKEITVASYGYDDDGRYSFKRVYSVDGKYLHRTGEIERE